MIMVMTKVVMSITLLIMAMIVGNVMIKTVTLIQKRLAADNDRGYGNSHDCQDHDGNGSGNDNGGDRFDDHHHDNDRDTDDTNQVRRTTALRLNAAITKIMILTMVVIVAMTLVLVMTVE